MCLCFILVYVKVLLNRGPKTLLFYLLNERAAILLQNFGAVMAYESSMRPPRIL